MFPAPRQRWVDALASPEADIRALAHETLIIHGRDDRVVPLPTSLTLPSGSAVRSCTCSAAAATGRRSSTQSGSCASSATSSTKPTAIEDTDGMASARDLLVELGRRKTVGGQEDMIEDLALEMSKRVELPRAA